MENALSRSLIKWWTRFEVWKKDSKGLEGKIGGSSFRGRGSQIRRKRMKNSREKERLFFAQEFRKIVIGILRTTMIAEMEFK